MIGGEEGCRAGTRKARWRGASARRGPDRPGPGPRPSPLEHVRRRQFGGCSGVGPPPSACARRTGGPHLLAGPRREGAGAPGVALAAAWAGAGPSSTKRHWAGSARAHGDRSGVGAGRVHKAGLLEGRYGERRGAECLEQIQRLKGTVCCARFLLKSGNPKGDRCRSFFSCTF